MIGKKIRGFKFENTKDYYFHPAMDAYIDKIGIIDNESTNCYRIIFNDFSFWYPKDLCLQHLVEEDIIGKKIRGFKFESTENQNYNIAMDKYIGEIGIIRERISNGSLRVSFHDDFFFYPEDLCLQHLFEEDIPTKDLNLKHLVIKSNMPSPFNDTSTTPTHYQSGKDYDLIDVAIHYDLNFFRFNVLKYICRAGKKDDIIKDLKKALDYLQREIKHLEL